MYLKSPYWGSVAHVTIIALVSKLKRTRTIRQEGEMEQTWDGISVFPVSCNKKSLRAAKSQRKYIQVLKMSKKQVNDILKVFNETFGSTKQSNTNRFCIIHFQQATYGPLKFDFHGEIVGTNSIQRSRDWLQPIIAHSQ